MRVVTWNMGYAIGGSAYGRHHDRAWRTLLELDPDVALVQEARPPSWVSDNGATVVGRPRNEGGDFQTVIWSKSRPLDPISPVAELEPPVGGQLVAARTVDDQGHPIVVASMLAHTGTPPQEPFETLAPETRAFLPADRNVWHQDLLLAAGRGWREEGGSWPPAT